MRTALFLTTIAMLGIARTNAQPGANDPTFNPDDLGHGNGDGFYPYDAWVSLIQPDGKIILSGEFQSYNGSGPSYLVRLNPDGSRDGTFQVGTGPDYVTSMSAASNGDIILGGVTTYDGVPIPNKVARIHANGTLDPTFQSAAGADYYIGCVAAQSDGKVIVAGGEIIAPDTSVLWVGRLNTDGSLDNSFTIANAFDTADVNSIRCMALTSDGKILVAGRFSEFDGAAHQNILRLNADGTLDAGFDPGSGSNSEIWAMAVRPDDNILVAGFFTEFDGASHKGLVQLNTDGSVDGGFDIGTGFSLPVDAGSDAQVFSLLLLPDGKALAGGYFQMLDDAPLQGLARLNTDGSTDASFDNGTGCRGIIYTMSLDQNGKYVVAGTFTDIDNIGVGNIARIQPDGSVDVGFNPGTGFYIYSSSIYDFGTDVSTLAMEDDGSFFASGMFHGYNGAPRNRLAHVLADGEVDPAFDPGPGFQKTADPYEHATINALLVQDDGKVIVGGDLTSYNGNACGKIARLNPDGSFDGSFTTGAGFDGAWVEHMAWQADGKLLVSGSFSSYNGVSRVGTARLNADGTLDEGFTASGANNGPLSIQSDGRIFIGTTRHLSDGSYDETWSAAEFSGPVVIWCVVVQPDGRLLVGGQFTHVDGVSRNGIARLNSDGSLDTGFDPGTGIGEGASEVYTMTLQGDGRIIIGGRFTEFNGTPRQHIARLESDGALDTSFDPGSGFGGLEIGYNLEGWVKSLAQQPGNKLIVGGAFTSFNGVGRNRIARLLLGNPIDCLGVENGPALPGTSCDDGLATTGNDVYGPDCVCAGLLIDCVGVPGGTNLPNTPCNDGDPLTGLDHYDEDCQCVGVPLDCDGFPGGTALPGTPCDDGMSITVNDTWTVDCDCVGQLLDCLGVPNGSALPGTSCDDDDATTGNDVWSPDCLCAGELIDCLGEPGGSALPGTACDDGNSATLNDAYTVDCICQGVTNACIPSQLTTTADPVISCGAVNLKLNGTSTIAATEVPGANKYQFRFTNIPGQPAYSRNIAFPTRSFTLTKWLTNPLKAGRTYNVVVRASFDNGATWCDYGPSCTVQVSWTPLVPGMEPRDMEADMSAGEAELLLFPNPTNGEQVRLTLTMTDPTVDQVNVHVHDLSGRTVLTRTLPATDGNVDQVLDLGACITSGLYMVKVTAGEFVTAQRLVVQR